MRLMLRLVEKNGVSFHHLLVLFYLRLSTQNLMERLMVIKVVLIQFLVLMVHQFYMTYILEATTQEEI